VFFRIDCDFSANLVFEEPRRLWWGFWIGLHDSIEEGKLMWTDGTVVSIKLLQYIGIFVISNSPFNFYLVTQKVNIPEVNGR